MENEFDKLKFVDVEEVSNKPKQYARIKYKNGIVEDITKEEYEKIKMDIQYGK